MFNQLAAAVLAYATRRLLWIWGAVYILVLACGLMDSNPPATGVIAAAPVPKPSATALTHRHELERMLSEGRQDEVDAIDCQRDWMDSGIALELQRQGVGRARQLQARLQEAIRERKPLPEFDRFPKLRSLDLTGCVVFPADAERLARCRNLKWLSLERAVLVDRNLNFIAGLNRLETLILGTLQSAPEAPIQLDPLQLPELRTLVLDRSLWETPQVLKSLAGSPRLHDLILKNGRHDPESAEIALARGIPSLRRIFVGAGSDGSARIRRWREALPGVRVWHAQLSNRHLSALVFLLLATLFLGAGTMIQARATFSVPFARLAPGFRISHTVVPAAVIAIGILMQTLIVRRHGLDPWSAMALQLAGVGAFAAAGGLGEALPRIAWPWRRRSETPELQPEADSRSIPLGTIVGISILLPLFGGLVLIATHSYVVESYLLGELPWWEAALFVAGAAFVAITFARLPRQSVVLNEAGLAPALSFHDMQKRSTKMQFWLYGSRRLERLPRQPTTSDWRWRAIAMRAGNPLTFGSVQSLSTLIGILIGVGPVSMMLRPQPRGAVPLISTFVLFVTVTQLMFCVQIWWQRRPTFSTGLLYPWTRRQMALAVFAAWGIDVAMMLVLPLALLLLKNFWLGWELPVSAIVMGLTAGVAAASMLGAGLLWVFTLRHILWAGIVTILGYMSLVGIVIGTMALLFGNDPGRDQLTPILIDVTVECSVIATFLGVGAYRRWMRIEWGLFGAT